MKRTAILVVGLLVLSFVGGCSGGGGDVSEGGALDKHKQIEDATKKGTDGKGGESRE